MSGKHEDLSMVGLWAPLRSLGEVAEVHSAYRIHTVSSGTYMEQRRRSKTPSPSGVLRFHPPSSPEPGWERSGLRDYCRLRQWSLRGCLESFCFLWGIGIE